MSVNILHEGNEHACSQSIELSARERTASRSGYTSWITARLIMVRLSINLILKNLKDEMTYLQMDKSLK